MKVCFRNYNIFIIVLALIELILRYICHRKRREAFQALQGILPFLLRGCKPANKVYVCMFFSHFLSLSYPYVFFVPPDENINLPSKWMFPCFKTKV